MRVYLLVVFVLMPLTPNLAVSPLDVTVPAPLAPEVLALAEDLPVPPNYDAEAASGKSTPGTGKTVGSSSGSGIAASIGLAAVTLGSETDGSITCPSSNNNIVGIKPTVGLTSRAGGMFVYTSRNVCAFTVQI